MEINTPFDGDYRGDARYFVFSLPAPELKRLAHLILQAQTHRFPLRVSVGEGALEFQLGAEHGRAQLSAKGTLTIVTNPVDLRALANELINMADVDDPELRGLIHIHLQDGFISRREGEVLDIVFERLDA